MGAPVALLSAAGAYLASALIYALTPRTWTIDSRNRALSCVHAVVATVLGAIIYVRLTDDLEKGDAIRLWLDHTDLEAGAYAATLGYLLFDATLGFWYRHLNLLNKAMWAHHALVVGTSSISLASGVGIAPSSAFLVNEASTPFVNAHGVMPRESPWRLPNGAAMFVSFGVCRIYVNSRLIWAMTRTLWTRPDVWQIAPFVQWSQYLLGLGLWCLNAWWFYRIGLGIKKAIFHGAHTVANEVSSFQHGTERKGTDERVAEDVALAAAEDGAAGAFATSNGGADDGTGAEESEQTLLLHHRAAAAAVGRASPLTISDGVAGAGAAAAVAAHSAGSSRHTPSPHGSVGALAAAVGEGGAFAVAGAGAGVGAAAGAGAMPVEGALADDADAALRRGSSGSMRRLPPEKQA